eukprot:scaffold23435_cov63-Phaeocystis_antarctica.AAC.1
MTLAYLLYTDPALAPMSSPGQAGQRSGQPGARSGAGGGLRSASWPRAEPACLRRAGVHHVLSEDLVPADEGAEADAQHAGGGQAACHGQDTPSLRETGWGSGWRAQAGVDCPVC